MSAARQQKKVTWFHRRWRDAAAAFDDNVALSQHLRNSGKKEIERNKGFRRKPQAVQSMSIWRYSTTPHSARVR
jgi:hypothetical protein